MLSGEKVKGKLSKATSKEIVLTNTRGAIEKLPLSILICFFSRS